MLSPSSSPKVRASKSTGEIRCSSVRPADVDHVPPGRRRRQAARTLSTVCDDRRGRGTPRPRRAMPAASGGIRCAPADERDGRHDPDHAAGAEGRVQVAGARAAEAEQGDGEDDVEHVERADRDRLGASRPSRCAPPAPPARAAAPAAAPVVLRRGRAAGPATGSDTSPPSTDTPAITAKTRPGEPTPAARPPRAGATTRLTALDPARDDVGRRQLLRCAREGRARAPPGRAA